MTIQLTAVLDIAPTHTADFESALTALAKAAATERGVLDYGFWRDPTHPGPPRCRAFAGDLPLWLATDSHALLETTSVLTRIPMLRT